MVKTISSWRGGSACAETATLISSQDQLRIIAFNSHHAVLDDKPVLEEPARGARLDYMLVAARSAKARCSTTAVAMPFAWAYCRPAASPRLLSTALTGRADSTSACMLLPRPEIRTTSN